MFIPVSIAIAIVLISGYAALIGMYYRAWNALPEFPPGLAESQATAARPVISVIIPARNESAVIERCVRSVLDQQGGFDVEVIVVDDHSEDDTASIVEGMNDPCARVLRLSETGTRQGEVAYKKRAIEAGVSHSRGEIIATTDADCRHSPDWLACIAEAFRSGEVDMVSGPVLFEYDGSLLQRFQALDLIGMIGITAASMRLGMFNLANGANLAFRKSVFVEVDGYAGIDKKASGDDMLLIYKVASLDTSRVRFLKSRKAAVYTLPAAGLSEFLQQRLRWTSKSFSYQDKRITGILAFVYLANVLYLFLPAAWILTGNSVFGKLLAAQVIVMFTADYLFLKRTAAYFQRAELLRSFLASQLLHIVYIVTIGLAGNLVKYRWKGRKLR